MDTLLLVITVLGVTSFIIFFMKHLLYKENKEETPENIKKIKIGETLLEFKRVERFDSEVYIEGTFDTVLHDIKNDVEGGFNTWELKIDYSKMQFEKIKYRSQFDKSKITLNIDYRDYHKFEIKKIEFETYSKTFSMKDINSEYYRFIYDCYVRYITEKNRLEKEKVDKSLSDINEIIGEDNLRDMKLEKLLNGED